MDHYGDVVTDEMAVASGKVAGLALNGARTERKEANNLKYGGEGGICSQRGILGPASCRKQYANVAKNATVATRHCPVLPAGHDLLTLGPTRAYPKREPVLRLPQASSNSCSDCARSVRLWSPAQFLPGAWTHESPSRPGQNKGNYGAGDHRIPGRGIQYV